MAEKTKAPSKNHKWDAKNKRWVLKTFKERQKGRNILLQGKNNPIRVVHDTIRNVNAAKEVRKKDSLKTNNKSNGTTKVTDHKDTGHTKLVKGPDGKVRRVKVTDTTKDKTLKGSDTSKIKSKSTEKSDDSEKAAWLKKTRNSPAAKSGAFTDDERWAQQVKHRKSQAARKAKTEAKKNSKNKAALKAGKIEREANEWGPGGQPKASKQMKKYKPKKKKKPLGSRLAAMFD
tara:strand:- start:828 stop:1520 length:693 start_codon:yes stop_codon:yes gene_type:complete